MHSQLRVYAFGPARGEHTLEGMNIASKPAIAFLGTGSMSGAILAGLLEHADDFGSISATTRSVASRDALPSGVAEAVALADEPGANVRLAGEADVVVLGVKPAQIVDLASEIADALRPGTLVISVAAGISIATLESALGEGVAVVRAMPNTPSLVGLGVAGLAAGSVAGEAEVAVATQIFEAVGDVLVVAEDQIDPLSAISGSGPAYVYLFAEIWTQVALDLGFTPEQAATMVQGTFRGASEMMVRSDDEPSELRRRVTSPKGTTEQLIRVLDEADLGPVFAKAADAAIGRARELSGE